MVKKKIEDTTPSTLSVSEQQEVYEFFEERDEELAMAAKDISLIEAAEIAMYGNMDRYK